ncbi:somatostatin receptor type 2-like isoform X2 [Clavelina lepadiformis]|uniref:somatostatin receptor type 2-like isoform X2 n=1 Tax=Clavelina lepadiformis TaxID=159417 RepID=UPI0040432DFE
MAGEPVDYSGYDYATNTTITENNSTDYDLALVCVPHVHTIIPVLFLVIATVGLAANAVVIYIIIILKEYLKTVTNIYVVQLALADFLFLFVLPFQARTLLFGRWDYGEGWCKVTESIRMLNYYSSILFLTVMSIDRFLAINYALNPKISRLRTRRATATISVIVWMLSFLSVVVIMVKAHVVNCDCVIVFHEGESYNYDNLTYEVDYNNTESNMTDDYYFNYEDFDLNIVNSVKGFCSIKEDKELSLWFICNFFLAFILPLVIICVCYAQILRKISQPMAVGSKSSRSNKTRKRVTYMVTALVTVFVTCWLPYHAFNLSRVNDSQLTANACTALQHFTLIFAYLSSALNPFLYTFVGTNFRKRWSSAVGRTRSFRPSFGSKSDYTQGQAKRRKSSKISLNGNNKTPTDDTLSQSNVTKHTVIPMNNLAIKPGDGETCHL